MTYIKSFDGFISESQKPFNKVKAGDSAVDYNDEKLTVIQTALGKDWDKVKKYYTFDQEPEELENNTQLLVVKYSDGTTNVLPYGDDGAWVKESETILDEMKSVMNFQDFVNECQIISEAGHVPSNILDFAKRKGPVATSLVKKVATWAEKAGKQISGGTAIGKNYSTIVLDMKYQGSEIYISLDKETVELFGEVVTDAKSFKKVLDENNK